MSWITDTLKSVFRTYDRFRARRQLQQIINEAKREALQQKAREVSDSARTTTEDAVKVNDEYRQLLAEAQEMNRRVEGWYE